MKRLSLREEAMLPLGGHLPFTLWAQETLLWFFTGIMLTIKPDLAFASTLLFPSLRLVLVFNSPHCCSWPFTGSQQEPPSHWQGSFYTLGGLSQNHVPLHWKATPSPSLLSTEESTFFFFEKFMIDYEVLPTSLSFGFLFMRLMPPFGIQLHQYLGPEQWI